jgi:hypothetical protein
MEVSYTKTCLGLLKMLKIVWLGILACSCLERGLRNVGIIVAIFNVSGTN